MDSLEGAANVFFIRWAKVGFEDFTGMGLRAFRQGVPKARV